MINACLGRATLAAAVCGMASWSAHADVPPPQDVPYQGTLQVSVDATDVARRIFQVREVVPAQPGPLTLLYPAWLPGHHSPVGPIDKVAGLVISANGQILPWKRDPLNVNAFHVEVPQGASSVDVAFQFLSPQNTREGRVVMTPEIINLQWSSNTLYPAGYYASRITTQASVKFPSGWQFGSALEEASREGDTVHFKPVSYETLVDSPMFAGKYFKRVDLDPGAKRPVHMNIVADAAKNLEITPEQLQAHRNLVQQLYKLYGSQHFDHYDLLLALSTKMSGIGLEHHRSSENGSQPGYFTEWDKQPMLRGLLPHEFNHSWNGKFRQPADLYRPTFNEPMQGSLLWVYEGQTQFWGNVLAARSGLWSDEQARDVLALTAATYDRGRPGLQSWRNVQDTTNDPVIAERAPLPYRNYQASEEYYNAGMMIWLDVDAKLRELSRGKHAIDDFAKAFFGMDDGSYAVKTYTFEDVVQALNAIDAFDWASFLRSRLDGHGPLIGGIESHGWKLVYTDEPSVAVKGNEERRQVADLTYSIGLVVGKGGAINDVLWDGPAFKAGVSPGMTVVAVNGHDYDADGLKDAIKAAKGGNQPIELLVKNFDEYRTLRVAYHDGLQYPHLVRDESKPDTLSKLLKAR